MRGLLIIPALNEGPRIGDVLRSVAANTPSLDILVVDDGSSDDTHDVAVDYGARVVRHPFRLGYGAALQTGYRFAIANGYSLCVQLDADGQHDPASVPALCAPISSGAADVVIGSRFLKPGVPVSGIRGFGTRVLRWLGRVLAGVAVSDPTSGFRALNAAALDAVAGEDFPDDFPDLDVLIRLHALNLRIAEVPTVTRPREGGTSMHAGLRPLYYAYKVGLAALLSTWRTRDSRIESR